ncbi:hypothetical protein PMZ80_002535 [Knufia obscura]|uniref:Uncharacterized protein n=1 Tax=Knufia obscura TaxID=1635080 RepID=A0ABR0RXK9_9EURO|nr:hypothetical protein PMZ80_002535 [Knufia obscura]
MSTVSQAILDLFALASGRTHASQSAAEVYELAIELMTLKQRSDMVEQEHAIKLQVLEPHRQRLVSSKSRGLALLQRCESIDDEDVVHNIDLLRLRDQGLQEAIDHVDNDIQRMSELRSQLKSTLDALSCRMMQLLNLRTPETNLIDSSQVITEDMILPSDLDAAELETEELEAVMAELDNQADGEAVTFSSEDADAMERQSFVRQYAALRAQKADPEQSADAMHMQQDIQELHQQLLMVCDELAIRGIPCRDGCIIHKQDDDADSVGYAPRDDQWEFDANTVTQEHLEDEHRSVKENVGQGLFENAPSHIERPRADSRFEDERWLSSAELRQMLDASCERVRRWREDLDYSEDQAEQDLPTSDVEHMKSALEHLRDMEVGSNWSMPDREPMTAEEAQQSTAQIEAWARIARRNFERSLQEHPEFARLAERRTE